MLLERNAFDSIAFFSQRRKVVMPTNKVAVAYFTSLSSRFKYLFQCTKNVFDAVKQFCWPNQNKCIWWIQQQKFCNINKIFYIVNKTMLNQKFWSTRANDFSQMNKNLIQPAKILFQMKQVQLTKRCCLTNITITI